ncbi:uncharacterized protein LOC123879371 [Maniola jurtina]|uniref:uncharacterized protein LOC123879371 n=1 Tax=Maniola jurtina TaxID=191418 RepID=UPI001E68DE3C|nr:uncharacterized protein LOC123879371 [Maniola jurtina]
MTNVLNKYVDTSFRFTEEMTEILLENIFGKNTDLRNNIFDVNNLLNYLRKSVDRHKIHAHKQVITLRSRHCLTLSIPGCFCKSGFVESSGQCVKPEDCITNENHLQYLTRIVVL